MTGKGIPDRKREKKNLPMSKERERAARVLIIQGKP